MSKRVSAKSAKASVVVDAMGGPSSVPQDVQEAGKARSLPASVRAQLDSQLSIYPPFRRPRKTQQNLQKQSGTSPS